MLFVGTHERQLDDKGRLALPAAFRAHLGETCYLSFGTDQCINVVSTDEFENMAADLMAQVQRGEITRAMQRVVSGSASLVRVDAQGRVNVDDNLRRYAGLRTEAPVIVTGNFTNIEIWSPEVHARVQAEGTSELAGANPPAPATSVATKTVARSTTPARKERGSTRQTPGDRR